MIVKQKPSFLKSSPVSTAFLLLLGIIFVLNIFKRLLIWQTKRGESKKRPCESLDKGGTIQTCNNSAYKAKFSQTLSCEGCRGKLVKITDIDAEYMAIKSSIWKGALITVANYGKGLLPYLTFIYTLVTAIYNSISK